MDRHRVGLRALARDDRSGQLHGNAPAPLAEGGLIGALNAVPVLITYSQTKPSSVLPVLGISIVLGGAVGFMTSRFAA